MKERMHINRRSFIALTGAVAAGAVIPGTAAAAGGLGFTNVGVNRFDGDGDGDIDVYAERDKRAVHFYSDGETGDYITSGANLEDEWITLGDFTGDTYLTLTYEYRGGPDNKVSAPDEVWLRLMEPDGTMHEVYRAENDGEPSANEWRTRNVHEELRGTPDYNQGYNWFELTSEGVNRLSTALVDDFSEDTQITRMAAGRGSFGGEDVLDISYRDPRYDGMRVSTFPSGRGRPHGAGR